MSFDEAAQIHEGLVGLSLRETIGRGEGIWFYPWYTFFIPLVVLIGLAYIPFLRRLPRRFMLRFVAAGVVFLSGSIGVEMLESYMAYQTGQNIAGGLLGLSYLAEETCEMVGVVILIHTLLLYIAEAGVSLSLRVQPDEPVLSGGREETVDASGAPTRKLEPTLKT
jgi:hypothetical protein